MVRKKGRFVVEYPLGLYDKLIDAALGRQLDELAARRLHASLESVDPAELPDRVGKLVGRWVADALLSVSAADRAEASIATSREILRALAELRPDAGDLDQGLIEPVRRLTAIERLSPTGDPVNVRRPITPLRDTVLMTNARDQPMLHTGPENARY